MDKKLIGLLIVIIIAVVTISGCIGEDNSSNTNSVATENYIGEEQAIEEVNIIGQLIVDFENMTSAELINHNGVMIYNVSNDRGDYIYIDAKTGEIVDK